MKSIKKNLLIAAGCLSLVLGVLGIFLPLLPTTPFLLLSGACFVRSSEKLYNWLIHHKYFGHYITHWRQGNGIPIKAKIFSIAFIWVSMLCSAYFLPFGFWKVVFLLPAAFFTWLILRQKTLQ